MFKYINEKMVTKGKNTTSSFQALMITTGSRVGTGNIAGIATAIILGGPGAVIWMWVFGIIGASSAFAESTLAQLFKKDDKGEGFLGGPSYYIKYGLKNNWLGIVFSIAIILSLAVGFNALQAYNAVSSLDYYFQDSNLDIWHIHILVGVFLTALTALTIFGGMQYIGKVSSVIVPLMSFLYIALALITIFTNLGCMGEVFHVMLDNACGFDSILGGGAGIALVYGTKRGLLSNEAGMGTAPCAAASASVSHPVKQGISQAFSALIDTFLICTSSAFMVMVFIVQQPDSAYALNGIPLVQQALSCTVGEFGIHFLTVAIFFFAFSTMIGNYSYVESNFTFIFKNKKALVIPRIVYLAPIVLGSAMSLDLVWSFADIYMGIQTVINIVAIFLLGKWVFKLTNDFTEQRKKGLEPVFYVDDHKDFPKVDCWHYTRKKVLSQRQKQS